MLGAIDRLAAQAQARELPAIHLRNVCSRGDIGNWFCNHAAVEGVSGADLDARVAALSSTVFDKSAPDSFSSEALDVFPARAAGRRHGRGESNRRPRNLAERGVRVVDSFDDVAW